MDNPIFNILSICSGVGMLDEGFIAACEFHGINARVVGYVEREASAAAMLLARMEESSLEPAPIWCGCLEDLPVGDIAHLGRVDCIVGGIPCQPFSVAGHQKGTEDERWLWPLMRDLARCLQARWIAIENVSGFIRDGLEPLLDDLAEGGWSAEWLHLSAAEVGASHKRERIFLLANAKGNGDDWKRRKNERNACLAVASGDVGNTGSAGLQRRRERCHAQGRQEPDGHAGLAGGDLGMLAPGPDDPQWTDILAESPWLAPATQPGVCVLADGLAYPLDTDRTDALRAAGNGVVALQAAVAFAELFQRMKNLSDA